MNSNKILLLFAHPRFEESKANKALIDAVKNIEGVTFHDLYERYPDFNIDVYIEKDLLINHDVIIWHHPFYWYSCPPLMKQWIDTVLEFGWAYGKGGDALMDKKCVSVVTTGGTREVYCAKGSNHYSIPEFLRPFEQTALLCGMEYLPPFAVTGTHKLQAEDLERYSHQYLQLIKYLKGEEHLTETIGDIELCNDYPEIKAIL